MRMKKVCITMMLCASALLSSCYEDEGNYDYLQSPQVTFAKAGTTDYTFRVGTDFEMDAPITLSHPVQQIDSVFTIEWYLNRECVFTGYHLKHRFTKGGSYELILKVINNETQETYLSEKYKLTAQNLFNWGWMVLSDRGEGKSALSFIDPDLIATHGIEEGIEGGLGEDPRALHYYYVKGTIAGSNVSGLPKVLVNQGSGSVTLDGNSLQKDMWLADEFENRKEPANLQMKDFAFKVKYYAICSEEGDLYIRGVGYDNHQIPYFGKYPAMPMHFEGGCKISCFAPFTNVNYRCADEYTCLFFDEQNARFIGIADSYLYDASYMPDIIYLRTYDQDLEVPSGVLRVDQMGAGTRCLAIGAYEKVEVDPESGAVTRGSDYVSLIDVHGTGDYQLHQFSVRGMTIKSHLITATSQEAFSGAKLLTPQSVIRMAGNFEKHPYFYFTDGGRNLYVYSLQLKKHLLAYTAPSRITHISASPVVCEFYGFGGNDPRANFRLALAQEDGSISVVDVQKEKLVRLFEGFNPSLELKTFQGFGNVKDIVWCTNYQGEY